MPPNPRLAPTPSANPSAGGGPSKGPPPPLPSKPAALVQAKVVVALHDYTADADGELTMEKGDEITVTDEGDNSGWWKGDCLLHPPLLPDYPLPPPLPPGSTTHLLIFKFSQLNLAETIFKCG